MTTYTHASELAGKASEDLYCTNCGDTGHGLKNCNEPNISVGVIVFRFVGMEVEYIMVCRKESYSMTDFMRGKYEFTSVEKLQEMFDNMTPNEINMISSMEIGEIDRRIRSYKLTRNRNFSKYKKLKTGIEINGKCCNLAYFLRNVKNNYQDPEWGFPKGRRNKNESNIDCAKRELEEETNIPHDKYIILNQIPPVIENLVGENGITYKYFYYVAIATDDFSLHIDHMNAEQICEISKIEWMTANSAISKFRQQYNYRKKILKILDDHIKMMFFAAG